MAGTRVFIKNLTANWVGHGANLLVMFFLSPYILHSLGVTEYGIWQLLTVLTGYMGIMDLGIRASTGRYIVFYLGKNEYDKIDETIRTGLGLYACISIFILIAGVLLGIFFPDIFDTVPEKFYKIILIIFPILAVNVWISAFGSIISSLLGAHERFDLARSADLIMLSLRTVLTIVALEMNMGLLGLTLAVILSNFFALFANLFFAYKIHNKLKFWPFLFKKERIKELYNYGIGAFIIAASMRILGQTDLFLAGYLIDIKSVSIYSVGAMLILYLKTFVYQINKTFFPPLQKSISAGKFDDMNLILRKIIKANLIVGMLLYIGCFSYGRVFIKLWMYDPAKFPMDNVITASEIMAILALAKLFLLFGSFSRSLLSASGFIGFAANMTILEAVLNLILSILLVIKFNMGVHGIALGTLISHLVIQSFFLPYYSCKKAGINMSALLSDIFIKGSITCFLFFGVCTVLQKIYIPETWITFFTQIFIAAGIYTLIVYGFILTKYERSFIKSFVFKKTRAKQYNQD
jgi:O-antigen/teichoic acid export membrane protein